MTKGIMYQSIDIYRYVAVKAVHNSLPFFAVFLGILGYTIAAVAILLIQVLTGAFTDLSFFFALTREVKH